MVMIQSSMELHGTDSTVGSQILFLLVIQQTYFLSDVSYRYISMSSCLNMLDKPHLFKVNKGMIVFKFKNV